MKDNTWVEALDTKAYRIIVLRSLEKSFEVFLLVLLDILTDSFHLL